MGGFFRWNNKIKKELIKIKEILEAISSVGFPIVVAVFVLIRIEPRLNKLAEAINKLIPIIKEDSINTKDVKEAIGGLKLEIAKLNGKK